MPLDPAGWPHGIPEKPPEGATQPVEVETVYESAFVELAAVKKQRDDALAEIARLKNELQKARSVAAHFKAPDGYEKHAMPERK